MNDHYLLSLFSLVIEKMARRKKKKKETRKGDMSKDIENVQNSSNSISKLYI
jgi:hypothetical protein